MENNEVVQSTIPDDYSVDKSREDFFKSINDEDLDKTINDMRYSQGNLDLSEQTEQESEPTDDNGVQPQDNDTKDNSAQEEANSFIPNEPNSEVETEDSSEDEESEPEESSNQPTFKVKADGQEYEFTTDELVQLAPKAINYTNKMKKIAPFRRMISALEEKKITEDELNQFIEMRDGNKSAISNFLAKKNISTLDISNIDEEESKAYKAKEYGLDAKEVPFVEAVEDLSQKCINNGDEETYNLIRDFTNQLDKPSQDFIKYQNPNVLNLLYEDIKNGVFQKVTTMLNKQRILGQLDSSKPFIDNYGRLASQFYDKNGKLLKQHVSNKQTNSVQEEAPTRPNVDKSKLKSTGTKSSGSKSNKVVEMISEINDEDFNLFYQKAMGRTPDFRR